MKLTIGHIALAAGLLASFGSQSALMAAQSGHTPKAFVAILPLRNTSEKDNDAHWGNFIPRLLAFQMEGGVIRCAPASTRDFALRQLGPAGYEKASSDEMKTIGLSLGVQYLAWGNYQSENQRWNIRFKVLNVGSNVLSADVTFLASDWLQVSSNLVQILERTLGLKGATRSAPSALSDGMKQEDALELTSRAAYAREHGVALTEVEEMLRHALAVEPVLEIAHLNLIGVLLEQGKQGAAELEIANELREHPESAAGFWALGWLRLNAGQALAAKDAFLKAIALDDSADFSYYGLGCSLQATGDWLEAISAWRRAEQLAPYDAALHRALMLAYAHCWKRPQALAEAQLVSKCAPRDTPELERSLAYVYDDLGQFGQACEHYSKCLELSADKGQDGSDLKKTRDYIEWLKPRRNMHFLDGMDGSVTSGKAPPARFVRSLTRDQYRLVEDPFGVDAEMAQWAKTAVEQTKGELETARRLFDVISSRALNSPPVPVGLSCTAKEAFYAWNSETNAMTCNDYACLYVALARSLGLNAFYVIVQKDCDSEEVIHACAGVITSGKALLVDPTYRWFGVPHIKFQFLNDMQAAGMLLINSGLISRDYLTQGAGLKLAKGCSFAHLLVALAQVFPPEFHVKVGLAPEDPRGFKIAVVFPQTAKRATLIAERELKASQSLQQGESLAWLARGLIEMFRGNEWDSAAKDFRSVQRAHLKVPGIGVWIDWLLGTALLGRGDLEGARRQYASIATDGDSDEAQKAAARQVIAAIDQILHGSPPAPVGPKARDREIEGVRYAH